MARGFRAKDPTAILLLAVVSLAACAGGRSARTGEPSAPPAGGPAVAASPPPPGGEPNGGRAPAFSPDGTRIAFLSSTLHTPSDLWVMNADGTGKRRLTTRGVTSFQWSVDGRTIHLAARRKGYGEVLSIEVESGREERFPGVPPNASLPIFSPDGTLFAFTAPGAEGIRDLWVGTADRSRVESVTEKIHVRSFFWAPDGRKLYYEPGKNYGLGIWEIDLATMDVKPILSKYIGTPSFSARAARVAYPYPTNPGEFEVHTMNLDGTATAAKKAPRLTQRWLAWAHDGSAVYYLGQEPGAVSSDEKKPEVKPGVKPGAEKPAAKKKGTTRAKPARKGRSGGPAARGDRRRGGAVDPQLKVAFAGSGAASPSGSGAPVAPHSTAKSAAEGDRQGTSLWRLDLETGAEHRVSPEELHVVDFSLSPDGRTALVTGVLPASRGAELFRIDLTTGALAALVTTRPSEWMPVPSPDATRVAYVTNEASLDAVRVADLGGKEIAAYAGFALEGDAKLFWLPRADGLLVLSEHGLHAFSGQRPIAFPNAKDHRAFLHADVSLQDDKVALIAVPKYGQTPGLHLLEVVDDAFVQTDQRLAGEGEKNADQYLQPRWAVDGQRLAFTDGIDVWTMKSDGTARRRWTAHAEANKEGKGSPSLASFPVWSVRGDLIAYTLTVYSQPARREIWVMGADGSSPRRIFSEELDSQFQVYLPEYTSAPFFDHSGKHLIATAVRWGLPNVVSIDVAEGKATALTETGAVFPAMLPEEDAVVYTSLEGNDERIWIMNADGTGKRPFLAGSQGKDGGDGAPAAK